MRKRKGFTLIELMIVILIVAILAAVLVPLMSSRINAAKWSEGKAGAGTVATALRAYLIEQNLTVPGSAPDGAPAPTAPADIGLTTEDLAGKYFATGNYTIGDVTYATDTHAMTYTITVSPGTGVDGTSITLDENGDWGEEAATP
jgi:type IV pilus assembly protein PilA